MKLSYFYRLIVQNIIKYSSRSWGGVWKTSKKPIICLVFMLICIACSNKNINKGTDVSELSESEYLKYAHNLVDAGQKKAGAEILEEFEVYHPYSKHIPDVLAEAILLYFDSGIYDKAITASSRGIEMYPADDRVPFFYIILAMSYYNQLESPSRDQSYSDQALFAFQDILRKFPDSEYARIASVHIDSINDIKSEAELIRGVHYAETKKYIAALQRFAYVMHHYPQTHSVPEAMYRIIEVYLTLGIIPDAVRMIKLMAYNYHGSEWYTKAYELMHRFNVDIDAYTNG